MHKVLLTLAEISTIRLMLRVLTVKRSAEVLLKMRYQTQVECPDTKILAEILVYTDTYRVRDHQLASVLEVASLQGADAIDMVLSDDSLTFYTVILQAKYDSDLIQSKTYEGMLEACRQAQPLILAKFMAVAPQPPVIALPPPTPERAKAPQLVINQPPAKGKN